VTAAPHLILAHGAGGNAATMQPHVEGLGLRGVEVTAIDIPKASSEQAKQRFRQAAEEHLAVSALGGHSYGGRIASMVAAEHSVAALILLSYPLHLPAYPDATRTSHWPQILCPVLLLSGESDPFARIDLLRDVARVLPDAELITYPGLGHGLGPVLNNVLDVIASFLARVSVSTRT